MNRTSITILYYFVATVACYLAKGSEVDVNHLAKDFMKNKTTTLQKHYIIKHYVGITTMRYSMKMYGIFNTTEEIQEESYMDK